MALPRRLLFSLGDLTVSVPTTIINFFQLWFLTDVARLPPAAVAWSLGAAKLWDAVNDPLIGLITDRFSGRHGRRRGPLLIAAPLLGLSFALLWIVPSLGTLALSFYYAVAFILFDTAYTLFYVSYNSLTPELAKGYDERSSLNGIRMAFSIGGTIFAVVLLTVLGWVMPDARLRFGLTGVVLGLASILPAVIVFRVTKGLDDGGTESEGPRSSMREDIRAVLSNKPFLRVVLLNFFTWTSATLISSILVYFVAYCLRAPEQANYLVLTAQASAIAFIPLVVALSKRWDKRVALIAGAGAWIFVQIGIAFLEPGPMWPAYALAALMGYGIATAYVVPWAMLPDTIDADRAGSGQRREGSHYAFATFFQKLGTASAVWIVGQVLALTGYVTPSQAVAFPEQPAAAVMALRFAIGAVPAIMLSGAIITASRYGVGRDEHRAASLAIHGGGPEAEAEA